MSILVNRLRVSVAVLSIFTVALLASAIIAEFTTEEDESKLIVVPTLFVALITGGASSAMLVKDIRLQTKRDPLL